MAVYEGGGGMSLAMTERLADDRMYAKKTEIKEKKTG